MRALLDIVRFEIRLQSRSPLFLALLLLTFAIHFLTARKWGVDIGIGAARDAEALDLNSTLAIVQNEIVLSVLAIFAAVALVAAAITRDQERSTASLFYTQPIVPSVYCWGRFGGGLALALAVALAGLAGSLVSYLAPGIDTSRLGPFAVMPWFYVLFVIVIPNTVIVSALAFAASALTRSIAAAFGVALVLPLLPFLSLPSAGQEGAGWLALADPFGALAIVDATRFLSRQELLSQLPGGSVWLNRLLWLVLAGGALALSLARYRFSTEGLWRPRARRQARTERPSPIRFNVPPTLAPFASQLGMDLRAILHSPPFWLGLVVIAGVSITHFNAPSPSLFNAPQLPFTGRLVGFLDTGLAMPMVLMIAWYAGLLSHRERQYRVADIADAAPAPTALPVLSKIAALFVMVTLLLAAAVASFVALQLAAGHRPIEPALWLAGMGRYGFSHVMLVIPALFVHLLFSNRWLGSLLFLAGFAVALSLSSFGYENLLYTFRLPPTPYSDMNGFGHFVLRDLSLMAYWAAFLLIVALLACLMAPRGYFDRFGQRLTAARRRLTRPVQLGAALSIAGFAVLGGWIHFNTHIRNDYVTGRMAQARAADYEKRYRTFAAIWAPSPAEIDMAVDIFPAERRLESRGVMRLVNLSEAPISEFLVTLNPALRINLLELPGAVQVEAMPGVRRYRLAQPLPAGAAMTARWDFSWLHSGFPNTQLSNAVAANGTDIEGDDILPVFGYSADRELSDPAARERQGLVPIRKMPLLDDPAARNDRSQGLLPASVRARVSTASDQSIAATGKLLRSWTAGGRRHFAYEIRYPQAMAFASARYDVLRSRAAPGEIFFDSRHRSAAAAMLRTMELGLAYYGKAFGPYTFGDFRIFEYPAYSTHVHALAGAVSYSEASGFALKFAPDAIDFVTAHELAHMWWGGQVRSAVLQGRGVINEGLATYAAYMLVEQARGKGASLPYRIDMRDKYVDAVSRFTELQPVIRAESDMDTYGKASLVLYALRDAIGEQAVNGGLKNFIARYGNRPPPYPTTRELVAELRVVTPPRYQELVTDLFEKVTFYDLNLTQAQSRRMAAGYEVEIEVRARKSHSGANGEEREAPLDAPFDIAVYGADGGKPLYLAKHWLKSGTQRIRLPVGSEPRQVAVDPYAVMIERRTDDNKRTL